MSSQSPDLLDPDVRFLLANERTLLAWIRTALALMAGGLALTQIGVRSPVQVWIGIITVVLGAVMSIIGYVRFKHADRAIRAHELPRMGRGPALQVAGVVGFAAILVSLELAHLL